MDTDLQSGLRNERESVQRTGPEFFPNSQNFVVCGGQFTSIVTHTHNGDVDVSSDFRMIPLGDLDLLNEIGLNYVSGVVSRQPGRSSVTRTRIGCDRPLSRRRYSARVNGRQSDMTVAVYQGQNAEEEWRRDISKYSGVRHPKFLQVYGVSESYSLYATVFHDDTDTPGGDLLFL
ncbi:hypothetical protein C8R44DRAFT_252320 [Mycena epipterygia]|nr:hypothetical protein C8R44DRAFT_252320 [Mycena epipterygia]